MNLITERSNKIVDSFMQIKDWEDRYSQIIQLGKDLAPMSEELKIESNKVKGCQSQVWLSVQEREGKLFFLADSDASIVKGIVALLVEVYSGSTPEEILNFRSDFIDKIGLRQHLSMSRANGLNSMIKQIGFYALAYQHKLKMK